MNYAGKTLNEDDLDDLGIDTDKISPEDINPYQDESDLERIGEVMGVSRFEGAKAVGEVEIEVSSDKTRVFEGMVFGTTPNAQGDYYEFRVDADGDGEITPDSDAFVTPEAGETTVRRYCS